jgi:hypothetical protein
MKQALQQGFTSRSRWLLQILGLIKLRKILFYVKNSYSFSCVYIYLPNKEFLCQREITVHLHGHEEIF